MQHNNQYFLLFFPNLFDQSNEIQEEDRPTFILNKLSSNLLDDISSQINTES